MNLTSQRGISLMGTMTKDSILAIAKKEDVRFIRMQFTDMLGTVKSVDLPVSRLEDAVNNKIMFDGSSIEGFVRIKEADMYLHPDLDSWRILTFEDLALGKVARLVCDVYTPKGEPFEGDPRFILKKAIKKMNDAGFSSLNVGFEPEFFLFKIKDGKFTVEPNDDAGYFDLAPIDGDNYTRRDIAIELDKLGLDVQASHHEVAVGQHEINFRFQDVLKACDNLQLFKTVVKVIARKHGLHATFMPKPIAGVNGSGMHTNLSLVNMAGENAFFDEKEDMQLSKVAKRWMSGILAHSRSIAALTNPTVNSYKRIIPGYEAPCYACWSDANRSAMIRIPAARGNSTRTELRNVDPAANPYLALAFILHAGLEGITDSSIESVPPVYDNIFELTREEREAQGIQNLPENLKDALKEMKKDPLMLTVLGKHTFDKYLFAKEKEWDSYRTYVSEWELNRYLNL
jgi:glutamine synthetase